MSRPKGFSEFNRPPSLPNELSERPSSSQSSEYGTTENTQPYTTRTHHKVNQVLNQRHIFLITISGVIGMGLFDNSGEILRIAGPLGGISAYLIVGLFVICIMEGIAEMVGHWPIANCMFEFVAKFVDRDLAIVVGIAYWCCYSIGFATLIVAAANLASFWQWSSTLQGLIFTVGIMIVLVCINCLGVLPYAQVESFLGFMKILLVIGAFLTMLGIDRMDTGASTSNGSIGSTNLDDHYQHDPNVAANNRIAMLVAIPIVAYAYCGVEIVAVTALEAKNQKSLKFPAKWIAYLTTLAYVLSVIGFYLNVSWLDPALPTMEGRKNETIALETFPNGTTATPVHTASRNSTAIVIIAVLEAKIPALPSILNVGLILAVLSTSNTSLYVASRTLYGLTKGINSKDPIWGWLSRFSRTTPGTKVPSLALLASALSFCWVPFLRFSKSLTNQELQEIMSGIATVSVVIVWAALCGAFIRYRAWLKMYELQLEGQYSEYNIWKVGNDTVPFRTVLGGLQPIPAWIGLISCLLIIFVFSTASWWNGNEKADGVAATFAAPFILIGVWCLLKFFRRRSGDKAWWVKLGTWEELQECLDKLAASRYDDDDNTNQQAVREMRSMDSPSLHTLNFRSIPQWLGRNMFRWNPEPVHESHQSPHIRGPSTSVSPATRPTQHALGIHDINSFDLARNTGQGSLAGHTTVSDLYRTSIPPRRKPVASTHTGSISVHSDQDMSDSSEQLIPPQESSITPIGLRSLSVGDAYEPPAALRRFSSSLVPPERNDFAGSSSLRPEIDERELQTQEALRGTVWQGQLTPQSPPSTLSPKWDEIIARKATSEPDTGERVGERQRAL